MLQAMLPYFTEHFGNAASRNHPFGWEAEEAVDKARKQVADTEGRRPIVFITLVDDAGDLVLQDGRHRLTAAQELGRDTVYGRLKDGKTGKILFPQDTEVKE